jgi:hypothetical protein
VGADDHAGPVGHDLGEGLADLRRVDAELDDGVGPTIWAFSIIRSSA